MKNFHRSECGFTFVEIMVATAVLGGALTSMAAFLVNTMTLERISRSTTIALSHARTLLDNIGNDSYVNIPGKVSSGAWDWDSVLLKEKGFEPLPEERIKTVYSGNCPFVISVTVSWHDGAGGHPRVLTLDTIMGGF